MGVIMGFIDGLGFRVMISREYRANGKENGKYCGIIGRV